MSIIYKGKYAIQTAYGDYLYNYFESDSGPGSYTFNANDVVEGSVCCTNGESAFHAITYPCSIVNSPYYLTEASTSGGIGIGADMRRENSTAYFTLENPITPVNTQYRFVLPCILKANNTYYLQRKSFYQENSRQYTFDEVINPTANTLGYVTVTLLQGFSITFSAALDTVFNALFDGAQPADGYSVSYDLTNCLGSLDNPTKILPSAVITNMNFSALQNGSFNSGSVYIDGTGVTVDDPVLFTWNYETGELRVGPVTSNIVVHVAADIDPYADLDVEGDEEIPDADTITMPTLPPLNAITSGLIGLFNPTPAQMKLLGDYMWTDFGGTGTTEVDVLKEIVQAIKRTVANPLDYVFGLNIIPSQGLTVGDSVEIRFGFTSSGVSMPRLLRQYFTVDCGTLSFDTLCGDTFLDYAPYAKFSIYLPYIGIKEVDANDFVGHTIGVIYRGDVVTGGVTAFITKDGSVMYQYSGSCALTLPLSSSSWGSTLAAAVQIATAIAGGAISGGAAGAVEGALSGAANVAANPSLLSPTIARSGAVSGAAGAMAVQTPYIIREAVRFHDTAFFNTVTGYPSYYYRQLGSLHGYTKVYDIHLHDVAATSEEITEIENLLQEGVIL